MVAEARKVALSAWGFCGFFSVLVGAGLSSTTFPLSASINGFSMKVLDKVMKSDNGTAANTVLSPFTLATIMAVIGEATSDEDAELIARTLFGGASSGNLSQLFKKLRKKKRRKGVDLVMENMIYVDRQNDIDADFRSIAEKNFHARVEKVDFTNPSASQVINRWVYKLTKGMIKQLIDDKLMPRDPDRALLLASAVYFFGKWSNPFDVSKTRKQTFYLTPRKAIKVDTMRGSMKIKHETNSKIIPGAMTLALPYQGDRVQLIAVVPNAGSTVEDLVEKLSDTELLQEVIEELKGAPSNKVDLTIPKFAFESSQSMLEILRELGIPKLDVSKLLRDGSHLSISQVVQKARIEVNEKSTRAAAVSAVAIAYRSLSMNESIRVNRPFVYLIHDRSTNLIVFNGVVTNPDKR